MLLPISVQLRAEKRSEIHRHGLKDSRSPKRCVPKLKRKRKHRIKTYALFCELLNATLVCQGLNFFCAVSCSPCYSGASACFAPDPLPIISSICFITLYTSSYERRHFPYSEGHVDELEVAFLKFNIIRSISEVESAGTSGNSPYDTVTGA